MTTFSIDFIQAQDQSIIDPKPNSKGFRLVNIEILISPQRSNHMNNVYTKGPLAIRRQLDCPSPVLKVISLSATKPIVFPGGNEEQLARVTRYLRY